MAQVLKSSLTMDQALARIAELEANANRVGKITPKVSTKGAISIYGLGKWPTTLYASQFDALFTDENVAMLRKFRADNTDKLAKKGE